MIGGMDCQPSYVGRSPVEIGEDEGRDPYDVLFDAIIESDAEAKGISLASLKMICFVLCAIPGLCLAQIRPVQPTSIHLVIPEHMAPSHRY